MVDRVHPLGGEPVGAFPTATRPHHRPGRDQPVVERAATDPAPGDLLRAGRGELVVVGVHLHHPAAHEMSRRVVEREAAHVERPQVERGVTVEDPLGGHLPGATTGGDAVQEAGGEEEVVELGSFAHHEIGVGRVRDRTVDQAPDAGLLQHRCALLGQFGELREAVEVGLEQLALERRRDVAVDPEGDRVGLVAADQQARPVRLVVDEVIRVAHGGHPAQLDRREPVDRPRQQVLVLDGDGRHAGTRQAADLHPPHPGRVDEDLALDRLAIGGVDMCTPTPVHGDRRDGGVLTDDRPTVACPSCDRLGHRRGIDVPVGREECSGVHVLGRHQREQFLGALRADDLHRQPERLGHRGEALQFERAFRRARQAQAAGLVPVDGLTRLGLQAAVHLDRLLQHPGGVARRAQLAHQAGSVPGRTVGELVPFEQQHVGLAVLGQPVCDRTPEDAAADDDDSGTCRNGERSGHARDHRSVSPTASNAPPTAGRSWTRQPWRSPSEHFYARPRMGRT
jgi:hypothetical protein